MTAVLNHTIIPATDAKASAAFLSRILELDVAPTWGPFVPLTVGNGVTLDFMDADASDFGELHLAFLVDEAEFDGMFERIRESGTAYYADPGRNQRGEINHRYGGRGVYFDDPDDHLMEIITQPYGSAPE